MAKYQRLRRFSNLETLINVEISTLQDWSGTSHLTSPYYAMTTTLER